MHKSIIIVPSISEVRWATNVLQSGGEWIVVQSSCTLSPKHYHPVIYGAYKYGSALLPSRLYARNAAIARQNEDYAVICRKYRPNLAFLVLKCMHMYGLSTYAQSKFSLKKVFVFKYWVRRLCFENGLKIAFVNNYEERERIIKYDGEKDDYFTVIEPLQLWLGAITGSYFRKSSAVSTWIPLECYTSYQNLPLYVIKNLSSYLFRCFSF